MKHIKIGKIIWGVYLIYWIIYNTYFGWNLEPENDVERLHDVLSSIILSISIMVYLFPLSYIYEDAVRSRTKDLFL